MMNTQSFASNGLSVESLLSFTPEQRAVLETALELAQQQLRSFANDPAFGAKMALAFGVTSNAAALQAAWLAGDFSILSGIELLGADILNGANGAYAKSTNRIYLSSAFLENHLNDPNALVSVLLEEAGHRIDGQLNETDALGDEGAIFSTFVQGKNLDASTLQALQTEDDHATITLNGQLIQVELSGVNDNTLGTAINVGALSSTQTFTDFVGSTDSVDYYRFSLTGTSNVALQLSGTSQSNVNAFVYYDANNNGLIDTGEQLYFTAVGAGGIAKINATLGASGNYYVGISPSSGTVNSNYSLQLAATLTPPSITPDPGNVISSAYNIGNLTSAQTFKEFVGSTDPIDYYKFSLTGTSDVALQLSGTSQGNVNAFIYFDGNNNGLIDTGEQLYSTAVGAGGIAKINATLGASGNYYVGISPSSGTVNSNYSLQLAAPLSPPSITPDPGNTFGTAYNIGNLTGTQTFKEFVGKTDPVDYYKFSLTGSSNVTLQLSGTSQGNVNAFIYFDGNNNGLIDAGEQRYSTAVGAGGTAQINATLVAPGNYYVGISPSSGTVNSNYSLQLSNLTNPLPIIAPTPLTSTLFAPNVNSSVENLTNSGNEGQSGITTQTNNDILIGVQNPLVNPSSGEVDLLTGSAGADTFVLGNKDNLYYVDLGQQDYALITNLRLEDSIQLHGNAGDYVLGAAPIGVAKGTGIFLASDPNELIGIIQGDFLSHLSLSNTSIFHFV
jgi:Ca2+-binding EF-hand superfamily protein